MAVLATAELEVIASRSKVRQPRSNDDTGEIQCLGFLFTCQYRII